MRRVLLTIVLLLVTAPLLAQEVIPIRYRVTRTASGQATIQHTFLKSAMECNLDVLPIGALLPSWLRITDPARHEPPNVRDCQWVDSAGSLVAGMLREVVGEPCSHCGARVIPALPGMAADTSCGEGRSMGATGRIP